MDPLRLLARQLARLARGPAANDESVEAPVAPQPMFVEDIFEPAAPRVTQPAPAPKSLAAAFRADTFSGFVDGFEGAVKAPVDLRGGLPPIVPEVYEPEKPPPIAPSTGFSASLDDLVGSVDEAALVEERSSHVGSSADQPDEALPERAPVEGVALAEREPGGSVAAEGPGAAETSSLAVSHDEAPVVAEVSGAAETSILAVSHDEAPVAAVVTGAHEVERAGSDARLEGVPSSLAPEPSVGPAPHEPATFAAVPVEEGPVDASPTAPSLLAPVTAAAPGVEQAERAAVSTQQPADEARPLPVDPSPGLPAAPLVEVPPSAEAASDPAPAEPPMDLIALAEALIKP